MTGDGLSLARAARERPDEIGLVLADSGQALGYRELWAQVEPLALELSRRHRDASTVDVFTAQLDLPTVLRIFAYLEAQVPFLPLHPRLVESERELLRSGVAGAAVPTEVAALVATSGTSGEPKLALLPRRAWLASAAASEANIPWQEGDRWLLAMPLAHVGGLSIVTRCLLARRPIVMLPRFSPEAALAALKHQGVTLLSLVPTMLAALLDLDRDNLLSRARGVLLGGAGAPPALLEACAERGVAVAPTYGLTEACSQVATAPLSRTPDARRGVGRPLLGTSVRIAGAEGEPGREGAILVRGPTLMRGYLGHEPLGDGFFDTGDVGLFTPEGELRVLSRRSDLIVTGGENVYPAEVEQVLCALGEVRDALVFGVDDARWGQKVCAQIIVSEPATFREEELREALAARLAKHKHPREIRVVSALPRTPLGKPDRRAAALAWGPSSTTS